MAKAKNKEERVPFKIQIGWSSRALSLSVNTILLMQLTYYCTNLLGMAPALVGTTLLLTKVFDGSTDFIQGLMINKIRTRWGMVRHYELLVVPMWICTVLLFSCPQNIGAFGQCVWIFAFSVLVNDIFAGMMGAGEAIYLTRAVPNQIAASKLMAINGVIIMVISAGISMTLPAMMATTGTTLAGWTKIALMLGVPFAIMGLGRFAFVPEIGSAKPEEETPISVKESLVSIKNNKYIIIIALVAMLCQAINTLGGSTGTYYFTYIIGDLASLGIMGMLSLVGPLLMLFFPVLQRKVGSINIARGALVVGIAGSIIKLIAGTNIGLLLIGNLLSSIGILPMSFMMAIYVVDCMTYNEWKTGNKTDGFFSALVGLAYKIGQGLASAGLGIIMGLSGFNGLAAVQTASANTTIVALYTWGPGVIMLICLLILSKYDLDKLLPGIRQELAEKTEA